MNETEEIRDKIRRAKEGDKTAKEELVCENMPLIKSVVRRYKNQKIEYEDLLQLGTLGLVKAINNFDLSYDVRFSTYAVPMIAGEIKRFIRDDGAIKVSRSVKAQAIEVNKYVEEFTLKNQRSPTVKEIAERFGIEPTDVTFITESTRYPVSMDAESDEDSLSLGDKIADPGDFDDVLDKMILKDAIMKLKDRDRKIIILRYFRDRTQSEVAEELGVSQVQISRLESKILKEIGKQLS